MLLSINPYALVLYAFKFSSFVNTHNFFYDFVHTKLNIQQGESGVSKTFVSAMMTVSAAMSAMLSTVLGTAINDKLLFKHVLTKLLFLLSSCS